MDSLRNAVLMSKSSNSLQSDGLSPVHLPEKLPHPPHMRSAVYVGSPMGRACIRSRTAMLDTVGQEGEAQPAGSVRSRTAMLMAEDAAAKSADDDGTPSERMQMTQTLSDPPVRSSTTIVSAIAKNITALVNVGRSGSSRV